MLKNLIIYRIVDGTLPTIEEAEKAIAAAPYIEAAKSAKLSCGFIPPRGLKHGAFVESVGGTGSSGTCLRSGRSHLLQFNVALTS